MTIAVTSDTLINRYYRDFRSSFYAADSGVNIVRQYMLSQLTSNANLAGATFATTGTPPLSSTDATSTLSNTLTAYGSTSSILGGQGANSWASKFYVVSSQSGTLGTTLGAPTCLPPTYTGTATNTGPYSCTNLPTCTGTCTGFAVTDFNYTFPYTITAIGQSLASEEQVVEDAGNLLLDVHVHAGGSSAQSFAGWGMFIDQYPECTGNDLVAGTITGPVFTNGAWNFGTGGSYTFTRKVGSVAATFGYDLSSGCQELAAASARSGSSSISPNFQAGYSLGANAVPLPTNTFSQKEAVVDGNGTLWGTSETTAQQNAAMNTALKIPAPGGAAYPSGGTTTPNVYLPYTSTTTGGVTTNTMTGGGIYVEGNADSVQMSTATVTVSGASHSEQIFTITQGSTVTTVTEDLTGLTTSVSQAVTTTTGSGTHQHTTTTTTTQNIVGIPENSATSTASPATMLYVDGNIGTSTTTGLSGPAQGVAAIQNGAAVTVTANGSINVTGDILYKEEPVTMTQSGSTPIDTLVPANNFGQVLGLFTATGNVNLYNQQSNNNLEIDASIATISSGGSGGIVNNGNAIGTLTIVGGRIQNTIQSINSTTRNVLFDQRFAQGGFAPPWFPSTTISLTGSDSVTGTTATFTRTQWLAGLLKLSASTPKSQDHSFEIIQLNT